MPATVADPNRSLDSEQISPATIAHHTVYENTPNLHQSHICQWGAQPYLVGPLSRLVGKPPLSPWVSADFLPLTQLVNNTNSAIPLTEIFDRVFSDVCNSLGFEVQKQKKRGSGNNRVYRNLNVGKVLATHTSNRSKQGDRNIREKSICGTGSFACRTRTAVFCTARKRSHALLPTAAAVLLSCHNLSTIRLRAYLIIADYY